MCYSVYFKQCLASFVAPKARTSGYSGSKTIGELESSADFADTTTKEMQWCVMEIGVLLFFGGEAQLHARTAATRSERTNTHQDRFHHVRF